MIWCQHSFWGFFSHRLIVVYRHERLHRLLRREFVRVCLKWMHCGDNSSIPPPWCCDYVSIIFNMATIATSNNIQAHMSMSQGTRVPSALAPPPLLSPASSRDNPLAKLQHWPCPSNCAAEIIDFLVFLLYDVMSADIK